jgi:hypothetical protein
MIGNGCYCTTWANRFTFQDTSPETSTVFLVVSAFYCGWAAAALKLAKVE